MKRILILLSEYGNWGEELIGPLETIDQAGYQCDFATLNGKKPMALPPSMDATYIDPPLGRSVSSTRVASKVGALQESDRLNRPLCIKEMVPERPYYSSANLLRELEAYYKGVEEGQKKLVATYDALLIVGGSGPIVDLANNGLVHDVILGFYKASKPIGAECYGVACLAFARDWEDRKSILWGKRVTGHCKEYDYKDGTGFLGVNFNMGPPPYPLEYILRDATGPEGAYVGNFGKETSVIVDYPFITGRSTPDSYLTGEKIVAVLEKGLTRWGW
jgi:putative intracellular protease/amidase